MTMQQHHRQICHKICDCQVATIFIGCTDSPGLILMKLLHDSVHLDWYARHGCCKCSTWFHEDPLPKDLSCKIILGHAEQSKSKSLLHIVDPTNTEILASQFFVNAAKADPKAGQLILANSIQFTLCTGVKRTIENAVAEASILKDCSAFDVDITHLASEDRIKLIGQEMNTILDKYQEAIKEWNNRRDYSFLCTHKHHGDTFL